MMCNDGTFLAWTIIRSSQIIVLKTLHAFITLILGSLQFSTSFSSALQVGVVSNVFKKLRMALKSGLEKDAHLNTL